MKIFANFKWGQALAVGGGLWLLAAILLPPGVFTGRRSFFWQREGCRGNLTHLQFALVAYQQDYDSHLPRVLQGSQGWADALLPYTIGWKAYQCPSTLPPAALPVRLWRGVFGDHSAPEHRTDYWYNANLSGFKRQRLTDPAQVFVFSEGFNDAPSTAALTQFPSAWLKNPSASPWRHLDGMNVAFTDGHVAYFRLERLNGLLQNYLRFNLGPKAPPIPSHGRPQQAEEDLFR